MSGLTIILLFVNQLTATLFSDSNNLITSALHKICEKKGFHWRVFCDSVLYWRIRVNESHYSRPFYAMQVVIWPKQIKLYHLQSYESKYFQDSHWFKYWKSLFQEWNLTVLQSLHLINYFKTHCCWPCN